MITRHSLNLKDPKKQTALLVQDYEQPEAKPSLWTELEVVLLQGAFRCALQQRKLKREQFPQFITLEDLPGSYAITIKEDPAPNGPPPLTQEAQAKRIALKPFACKLLVVNGIPKGPVLLSDNSVYVGEWKEGKRYGMGICYMSTGSVMEGYWSNGLLMQGRTIFPNGNAYEGQYFRMRRRGKGRFEDFKSQYSYDGEWFDDLKHGFGVEKCKDGSIYVGEFYCAMRQGRGTLRKPIGEVYIGDFRNNLIHGKGKYTWTPENHYAGNWLEGKGVLVLEKKEYTGDFVEGKKHGYGELVWEGNLYEGEFQRDMRHGIGWISEGDKPRRQCRFEQNREVPLAEEEPRAA
jgi:hypothetical protein